ncbi:MAG: Eco57I restriction-modification methylase domain-containing protein [Treponema sp.]|nr:Eco57I restriction-modification methylase domain-containing protein [Treponema sp.]
MKLEIFNSSYGYYNLRTIDGRPTEEMLNYLKENGYRWSRNNNAWYPATTEAKNIGKNEQFVKDFQKRFFDPAAQEQKSFGQELFEREQRKQAYRDAHGLNQNKENNDSGIHELEEVIDNSLDYQANETVVKALAEDIAKNIVDEKTAQLEALIAELREERRKDQEKIAKLEFELANSRDEGLSYALDIQEEQQHLDEEAEWERENTLTEEEEQEIIENQKEPSSQKETLEITAEVMDKVNQILEVQDKKDLPKVEKAFIKDVITSESEVLVEPEEMEIFKSVMPISQYVTTLRMAQGEEGNFFKQKIKDIAEIVNNAPKIYETGGAEQHPIVLRYFHPTGTETLVTEIGKNGEAYGFQCLNGDYTFAEWGYIDLNEVKSIRMMEIDYHVEKGMTVERWLYKNHPDMYPEYAKFAEQPEVKSPLDVAKETGNDVEAISESLGQHKRYYYNPYSQEYLTIAFEDNDWHTVFYDKDYNVLSDDVGFTASTPKTISEVIDTVLEMRYHIDSFDPEGMSKSEYEATKAEKERYLSKNWTIWTDEQGFEEILETKRKAEHEKENKILYWKDVLKKDEELKQSALVNNRQEFANAYYDKLSEILIKEYDNDKSDLIRNLLDSDKAKKEIMGEYIDEVYDSFNSEKNSITEEKPYNFFINDAANLDLGIGAEIEPITGLSAEKAALKYAELKDKGLSPYIGLNIPGDFIFDDKYGEGAGIFTETNGHPSFYIGDNFVKELKKNDEHAKNVLAAYKELYEMTDKCILGVEKPDFVFEKENELFENIPANDEEYAENLADWIVQHAMNESTEMENYSVSYEDILENTDTTEEWLLAHIDLINDALTAHNDNELLEYNPDENEGKEFNLYFCSNSDEMAENTLFKQNEEGRWIRKSEEELKKEKLELEKVEIESPFDRVTKQYSEKYKDFYSTYEQMKAQFLENESRYIGDARIRSSFEQIHDELVKLQIQELNDIIKESANINEAKENAIRYFNFNGNDGLTTNNLYFATKIGSYNQGNFSTSADKLNEYIETKFNETHELEAEQEPISNSSQQILSWEELGLDPNDYDSLDVPKDETEFKEWALALQLENELDLRGFDTGLEGVSNEDNSAISEQKWAILDEMSHMIVSGLLKYEKDNYAYSNQQKTYDNLLKANPVFQELTSKGVIKADFENPFKFVTKEKSEQVPLLTLDKIKFTRSSKDELYSFDGIDGTWLISDKMIADNIFTYQLAFKPKPEERTFSNEIARNNWLGITEIPSDNFVTKNNKQYYIFTDDKETFRIKELTERIPYGKMFRNSKACRDEAVYLVLEEENKKRSEINKNLEQTSVNVNNAKLIANISWAEFTEDVFNKTKEDLKNWKDGEVYAAINVGQLSFELVPQNMGDRMELFTNIYYPDLNATYGEDADGVKYDTASGFDIASDTFIKMSYEEFKEYFANTVLPSSLDKELTERALKPTEDWNTIWEKLNKENVPVNESNAKTAEVEQLTSKKDIKAIREQCKVILQKPDSEITEADKAILAQYEGAGGLNEENRTNAGILNEFYTPNNLVDKVWQIVDAYAPNAKTVLEPSAGLGKFANNRPGNEFTMHELDETSARINKILHSEANVIQGAYQKQFFDAGERLKLIDYQQPKYDVVIGNPPYGKYNDKYKGLGEGKEFDRYEEYFIAKGLEALKDDNSLLAFVVPSGFLNTASDKQKNIIASKGILVDAYRLPVGTFPTTEVGTDIIILKSREHCIDETYGEKWDDLDKYQREDVIFAELDKLSEGNWFKQHPEKILGEVKTRTNRFGKEEEYVVVHEGLIVQDELNKIDSMLPKLEKNISPADRLLSVESKENEIEESLNTIKELEEKIYKKYIEADIPPVFSDKEGYAHTISHELAEGFIHKNNLGNTVTLRHHLSSTNHNISYKERQLVKEIFEEVTGYYLPAIEEGNETVDSEIKSIIKLWQNGEKQKMEYSSKNDVLAAYHAVITPALEEIYPDDPNKVREETLKFSEAIETMDFHKLGSFILWTTEREEPVKIAARKVFEEKIGKTFPTFDDVDDSEKRHLTELWLAKQTNAAQKSNYYKMYDLHSEQDVLEYLVSRGTITQGGKERINEFFEKNSKDQERIKFLINEYGWGGSYQGVFSMNCKNDSKGIKVEAYITNPETDEVTKFDKMVSWKDICNEIKRQRLLDIYLDKPIKESVQDQHSLNQTDNKGQAPKVKSPRAKKEKWNITKSKGEVMSAEEFSRLYGRDFDEREFPIWAATDWQGNIDLKKLTTGDIQYMHESGNYVQKNVGEWTHKVLFTTGDIYAKIEEQIELRIKEIARNGENSEMAKDFAKNIELLESSKKASLDIEHIHFGLKSTLAEEFTIPMYDGENMVDVNLQEAFILWAKNETLANTSTWRGGIEYATANITREELGEGINFNDIVDYIDGKPVKAQAVRGWRTYDMSEEEKKAEKSERKKEADLKRQARADVANKLFDRYIHEGLELETIKRLEAEYNRRFNSYIIPDYSKLPLFVDGMSAYKGDSKFKLYDQQIKGISFLCNKGNGLLAYDVGVGKTAAGIVATKNQIQTGRSQRPLVVVPNQVYSKWYTDIKQLFPNVQVNDLYNFNKESVGKYVDSENPHKLNIPVNSISLCTYEALKNITFTDESCENELYQDFANLLSADMDGSERENAQDSDKIKGIIGSASHVKDASYYFFEDCGFDHITVDEAHNFKNLWVVPRPKKKGESNEYSGIPSGKPSARALKLYGMTQLVQRHNDDRNVFLLTATPFTNSPTEVYSMLSYIGRERLQRAGITSLRSFFDQFAQTKQEFAVTSKGEIDTKQVMKNWKELPALQNILTEFIDKVDGEEAGIVRPNKFTHVKPLDMSELQQLMRKMDEERMAEIKEGNSAAVIVAMNNMRLSCVAPALANPDMYEGLELPPLNQLVETSPKLKFVCDAIIDMYKENPEKGQFMYVPLGKESHGIIKDYLVQHGIPKEAVEIINGEVNNTPEKKEKITSKFNNERDKCKIIIGGRNTAEGIDLNGNSFVMYNCSLGWNPSETIQAEGRIWRQGNLQGHVHIVYPVMNDSIDSVLYQKHDEKRSRVNELWNYKGDSLNVEDINPEDLKLDLIKDPQKKAKLILEEETKETKAELAKIKLKIKDFDDIVERRKQLTLDFGDAKDSVKYYEEQIEDYKSRELEVPEWIKTGLKRAKKSVEKSEYQKETLNNKLYSWNIQTPEDEEAYIRNLNTQKERCEEKIKNITAQLPEILQKLEIERLEQKVMEYPVTKQREILEADILNNLRPMPDVKHEILTERHYKMLDEKLKAGDITQEEHDLYKAAGYENYEKWLNGEIESLENIIKTETQKEAAQDQHTLTPAANEPKKNYQVITYSDDIGADEKPEYSTLKEAKESGKLYMQDEEQEGFGVFNLETKKIEYTYGNFPVKEIFSEDVIKLNEVKTSIKEDVEAIPSQLKDAQQQELFDYDELFKKLPDDNLSVKSPEQPYFNFGNDDTHLTPDQLTKAELKRDEIVLPILNGKESGMYKAFNDFAKRGVFDIIGTNIELAELPGGRKTITEAGFQQLHATMNIYRDKQFETMRYVFINKDTGKIRDQLAISSCMPNYSSIAMNNANQKDTFNKLIARAELTDSMIVVVHNHPSGNIEASDEDIKTTEGLDKILRSADGERLFAGHIILDHKSFNVYDPLQAEVLGDNRGWATYLDKDYRYNAKDEMINENFEFKNLKARGAYDLADVARKVNEENNWNDDFIPVCFSNANSDITAVKLYHKSFFNKEADAIRNEFQFAGIESGSIRAFPVITNAFIDSLNSVDRMLFEEKMKNHINSNAFTDAVIPDTTGAARTIVEKYSIDAGIPFFTAADHAMKQPDVKSTWQTKVNPSLFEQVRLGTLKVVPEEEKQKFQIQPRLKEAVGMEY